MRRISRSSGPHGSPSQASTAGAPGRVNWTHSFPWPHLCLLSQLCMNLPSLCRPPCKWPDGLCPGGKRPFCAVRMISSDHCKENTRSLGQVGMNLLLVKVLSVRYSEIPALLATPWDWLLILFSLFRISWSFACTSPSFQWYCCLWGFWTVLWFRQPPIRQCEYKNVHLHVDTLPPQACWAAFAKRPAQALILFCSPRGRSSHWVSCSGAAWPRPSRFLHVTNSEVLKKNFFIATFLH